MSKQLSYQLHTLIHSLEKSEKRHFKLYANRNFGQKEKKFLELFDVLDKMGNYDENRISKKFETTKGSALSNLKAHLYDQILASLHLLHHKKNSILIRDMISYAEVLYQKGLYGQSLGQLAKAKKLTKESHKDL